MDRLLYLLKESYQDLSEEQEVLKELEDALNAPVDDTIEDPTDFPAEEPDQELPPIKSTVRTPPPRPERKIPTKEPAKEPAAMTPQVTPKAVKTPTTPSAAPMPQPAKEPAAEPSQQPQEPISAAPMATPASGPIMKRLLALKAAGKTFDAPLKSRALSHMTYDPNEETLKVTFTKNGRQYLYSNVNLNKARMLIASNHKGSLFNRVIKPTSPYQEI